jgi:hypothetical protein
MEEAVNQLATSVQNKMNFVNFFNENKLINDNIISERYNVPISLNHELTQFTRGKTEQTLNEVIKRYLSMYGMND